MMPKRAVAESTWRRRQNKIIVGRQFNRNDHKVENIGMAEIG
jgi:hypothetical protein